VDRLSLVLGIAGALLVVAGVAKILNPRPTAAAIAAVGRTVPVDAIRTLGVCEATLGIAAFLSGNDIVAFLTGFAYVGFSAFVVAALRPGRDVPSCGCFGTIGGRPRWAHVGVNVLLAGGSIGAGLAGARSIPDIIRDKPVTAIALVAGVGACYVILNRWRDAPPIATGTAATIGDLDLRGGRTALMFLSTTCLTCRSIFTALAEADALPPGVRPVVVVKASEPADKVAALMPRGVALVRDSSAWDTFAVSVAPAVVLLDDGVVVASGLAGSWDQVVELSSTG
jgi:hypothetical protein